MSILFLFAVYTALLCGLIAVVRSGKYRKYYIWAKAACSFSFLAVLFAARFLTGENDRFFMMLPAFFCCFAGDILLGFYNRFRRKPQFLAGLFVFLAGHLFFVRWICTEGGTAFSDVLFPLGAVGLALLLTSMKRMHTGRLRPFILIYAFFVALFFSAAVRLAVTSPAWENAAAALGAGLILVSDISILFLYFYKRGGIKIHIFNLLTYYYGMFVLAGSLFLFSI